MLSLQWVTVVQKICPTDGFWVSWPAQLVWGVRRASVIYLVLLLIVVMCPSVLLCCFLCLSDLWSQRFIQHHGRSLHSAPPRVVVVSGLVRQANFVPSRRFSEDGLEYLELAANGGGAPE